MVVQTEQGSFIKLLPQVVVVNEPETIPIASLHTLSHEDLSADSGLYSNLELTSYDNHIEQEQYCDALMSTIAYGSQVYSGNIQGDSRFSFDLGQLRPAVVEKQIENLGLDKVKMSRMSSTNFGFGYL